MSNKVDDLRRIREARRIRVLTWNILADVYDSTTKLSFEERSSVVSRTIETLDADLILLQEVDHWFDYFLPSFEGTAYGYQYYQRPTRKDGIVTLYRKDIFELVDESEDVVRLDYDDIAKALDRVGQNGASFRRQNVGLLLRLRLKEDKSSSVVVANTHLYWSPAKPEVKLAQTRMLIESIEKLACTSGVQRFAPVIMGGDFNSVPTSDLYRRIQEGKVFRGGLFEGSYYGNGSPPKFLADTSLKKLCSWLRMLGVDCAMESEESEFARTAKPVQNFDLFFSTARSQSRIILSSSRKLTERANCPLNFYVKTNNFEAALVEIVRTFNVEINENTFLTVCGKCGGRIRKSSKSEIRESFSTEYLPEDGRPLFQCVECMQPYWWNERVDSSPARAMRVASRLFDIIKSDREGEKVRGKSASMPSSVYANGVTEDKRPLRYEFLTTEDSNEDLNKMFEARDLAITDRDAVKADESIDMEKAEDQDEDSLRFSSAYALVNDSEAEFTNWAGDFKGTLDYVFVSKNDFDVKNSQVLPSIMSEGESEKDLLGLPYAIQSYHGTPNLEWPSDHFVILVEMDLEVI